MKLVTFTRDVLPNRAGETRIIPDVLAEQLEANGEVAPDAPYWPEGSGPDAAAIAPPPRQLAPRNNRRQTYLTK